MTNKSSVSTTSIFGQNTLLTALDPAVDLMSLELVGGPFLFVPVAAINSIIRSGERSGETHQDRREESDGRRARLKSVWLFFFHHSRYPIPPGMITSALSNSSEIITLRLVQTCFYDQPSPIKARSNLRTVPEISPTLRSPMRLGYYKAPPILPQSDQDTLC
ncbi:hypothetical protein BY996DRAFT_8393987 [Phakopsora pachyrhizi]|nr:hypothetical protein BY996DRAFT_8393987 [Phakopsora pachyrhizi]